MARISIRTQVALIFFAAGAIALFIWGANQQSMLVNTNMFEMDQSAYMDYARNLSVTQFRFVGGRNRMPLYPALMSFLYEEGISDQSFFTRGKTAGIFIGIVGLLVTSVIFRTASNLLDAVTATFVAAFTVFVYKAPYFQADILFYPIGLLLFVLLLSLIKNPNPKVASIAGFVGGIGQLTKAAVHPIVFFAAAVILIRGVTFSLRKTFRNHLDVSTQESASSIWKHLGTIAVLLVCFHIVIYPYLRTSKERFGRYYYNVNSTFYIWYDSWEQAEQGTKAHGDRLGWPNMPEEDIPCLRKYISEHTVGQIMSRLYIGFCSMKDRIAQSYGYAEYVLIYLVALLLLMWQNRSVFFTHLFTQKVIFQILFISGYFAGLLLLFAWYNPIAAGNRFPLILYLPLLYLVVRVLSFAQKNQLNLRLLRLKFSASSISLIILYYLAVYVAFILPDRVSTMFGGS